MLKSLLSLFLQERCPLCQRVAADIVCADCQSQLHRCKWDNCAQLWQGDLPVFIWGSYGDILKRAIATLKYDQQKSLAQLLGYCLGQAWLASSLSSKVTKLTVVPIPLHHSKLKARGFNQADLIARAFTQVTGYHLQTNGLARVKATAAMFGLNPQQRAENIKQAFSLGKNFQRRLPATPVLLVDDIYTTGTTVRAAAKLLRRYRVRVLGVAAIASSQRN